jgi:hypothetical protein
VDNTPSISCGKDWAWLMGQASSTEHTRRAFLMHDLLKAKGSSPHPDIQSWIMIQRTEQCVVNCSLKNKIYLSNTVALRLKTDDGKAYI